MGFLLSTLLFATDEPEYLTLLGVKFPKELFVVTKSRIQDQSPHALNFRTASRGHDFFFFLEF